MKKLLLMAASGIMLYSCGPSVRGSGKMISETRSTGNFNGISSSSSIDVDVVVGNKYEVVVDADDNVIKYVKTTVENGVLKVRYEHNTSFRNTHVVVHVTAPSLEKLMASSSSSIKVDGTLSGVEKIEVKASSSANIDANVDAPEVVVEANSSADVQLSGKTKNSNVDVSSSGVIDAFDLLSENTVVEASSSGNANVHASVSLKANANSSGTIRYKGGASITKTVSSSGSVEKE